MTQQPSLPAPCRSVFRGGAAAATTETYTRLWIALINQMERSKSVLAGAE